MRGPGATSLPVRIWRCLCFGLHFVYLCLGTALLFPIVNQAKRVRCRQRWSLRLLSLLAVHIETTPFTAPAGCLIVANHISWLDIFAINAVRPSAFIAKSEVRGWPFIGWLSARHDTIFLRRGSHGHAREINAEIEALLHAGRDVALFPEGTTTDGSHLRPFHAALLQPAVETSRPILPLALSYHDSNGNPSPAPSYAGETSLLQCFAAILSTRSLTARIQPCPIIATDGQSRRELARLAHAAIAHQHGYQARTSSAEHGT